MKKKVLTPKKIVKTQTISDIINVTMDMGDQMINKFEENKDFKLLTLGLHSYKTAISASRAQLVYKKLTGKPNIIPFLER